MRKGSTIISILLLIMFTSCEPKEYYPDINDSRDSNLIGTWRDIHNSPTDSSGLFVFTKEGYADGTYWVNNQQMVAFFNLGGLWYNIQLPDSNGIGIVYHASTSSSWQMRRWTSKFYYKITGKNDTLLMGSNYHSLTDTSVWNDYQLLYKGPKYIGIDTLKEE